MSFKVPEAEWPSKLTIWARLLGDDEIEICRNYQEIIPSWSVRSNGRICVFGADAGIVEKIREIGLTAVEPSESSVAASLGVNEDAFNFAEKGGRVLFLLDEAEAGSTVFGRLRLAERSEKGRWGDWCTSFLWFKKDVTNRLFFTRAT